MELDLTEGRCTGIPTIQGMLERNGSPKAVFETDDDRLSLCVTIPIQPEYYKGMDRVATTQSTTQSTTQLTTQSSLPENALKIYKLISGDVSLTQKAISEILDMNVNTVKYHVRSLMKNGFISRNGNSRNGEWIINKEKTPIGN